MTNAEAYAREVANEALLEVDAKDQRIWHLKAECEELRGELSTAHATIAELRVKLVDHQTLLAEARQRAQEHSQAIETLTRQVNRLKLFRPS